MENRLVANSVTLAGLRGLLRTARKKASKEEAVYVELSLWNYNGTSLPREFIGVYRSGTGTGTQKFKSLKEARKYIEGWKKEVNDYIKEQGGEEETDGNSKSSL